MSVRAVVSAIAADVHATGEHLGLGYGGSVEGLERLHGYRLSVTR